MPVSRVAARSWRLPPDPPACVGCWCRLTPELFTCPCPDFLTESEEAKDSALVEAMYKRQSERAAAWRRLQLECDEFLRPIHLMLYAALLFFCFVLYLPSQHGGTPTETPEVFTSMDSVGEYIGFHLNPGMGGFYP